MLQISPPYLKIWHWFVRAPFTLPIFGPGLASDRHAALAGCGKPGCQRATKAPCELCASRFSRPTARTGPGDS